MPRILVVDDKEGTRATYYTVLSAEGYDVGLASSCATAIELLSQPRAPDAIFLDLNLGPDTGLDVLRRMRADHRFVPTAAMTAFRPDFDPDEAIELGALAYVDQPLAADRLVALARSLTRPTSGLDDPNELHERVCAGDPGALEGLDAVLLRELPRRLASAFRQVPPDFVEDAVSSACLEYGGGAAHRFDASKGGSVLDFVSAIARRNLQDRLRSESSRADRERRWAREQPVAWYPESQHSGPTLDVWATIVAVTKDRAERRAAEVWLGGGGGDQMAAELGLAHLDPPGRRRACRQFKDRLIKRLSRYVREQSF